MNQIWFGKYIPLSASLRNLCRTWLRSFLSVHVCKPFCSASSYLSRRVARQSRILTAAFRMSLLPTFPCTRLSGSFPQATPLRSRASACLRNDFRDEFSELNAPGRCLLHRNPHLCLHSIPEPVQERTRILPGFARCISDLDRDRHPLRMAKDR